MSALSVKGFYEKEMDGMEMQVMGGQVQYRNLTLQFRMDDEKEYERTKAAFWLYMLQEGKEPVKWLKPNKNGTKVNFEMVNDKASFDRAVALLEAHIKYINELYGLDLEITHDSNKK